MEVRNIEAAVHGRYLFEQRPTGRLLVGFHGYAENAEISFAQLQRIPGAEEWSLLAIQALHPFYSKQNVVANWMTSLDREMAIADNLAYVRSVLRQFPDERTVFLGFSQGAAMAYRAAARIGAAGLIALGGDVPPDVRRLSLPPVLHARGRADEWYTADKYEADIEFLRSATTVTPCLFDGGHEWTDEFRAACGSFLRTAGGS